MDVIAILKQVYANNCYPWQNPQNITADVNCKKKLFTKASASKLRTSPFRSLQTKKRNNNSTASRSVNVRSRVSKKPTASKSRTRIVQTCLNSSDLPVATSSAEEEDMRLDNIARSYCLNAPAPSRLYALMLKLATFFFGFLEQRKVYDLRKQMFDINKCDRVLLVCTAPVRMDTGVSYMLEGNVVWRSPPLTAQQIIHNPEYLSGTMLTPNEVTNFLDEGTGFLYKIENVRRSELVWFKWPSNGSNCFGFVPQFVQDGKMQNFPRFGPVEWDQSRWTAE